MLEYEILDNTLKLVCYFIVQSHLFLVNSQHHIGNSITWTRFYRNKKSKSKSNPKYRVLANLATSGGNDQGF